MKVAIASDFSGFRLKEAVKAHVLALGYDLVDVSAQTEEDMTLYFDAAAAAARLIQNKEVDRAIAICSAGSTMREDFRS